MEKTEVLIDTCFVERLTDGGEHIDDFAEMMKAFPYSPVVHPYLYDQEFLLPYQKKLVTDGLIQKAEYAPLGPVGSYKWGLYDQYFRVLYDQLKQRADAAGHKQMVDLPANADIFSIHIGKSSLGDVHLMTYALVTEMPIILTEDSDITILQGIAAEKISTDSMSLQIYDTGNLILQLAGRQDCPLPKKKLKNLLKATGKKDALPAFQKAWDNAHTVN